MRSWPMTVQRWAALVFLLGALAYANNLQNQFSMDDPYNVVNNSAIRSLSNVPSLFTEAWGETAGDDFERSMNAA